MKKSRLFGVIAVAAVMACSVLAFAACGNKDDGGEEGAEGGWETFDYTYNGTATNYAVYIPAGYKASDTSTKYPLVCFMPDATLVGSPVGSVKSQNGAKVWTTDEWQAEHPCFVVIPQVAAVSDPKEEMFYSEICEVRDSYNIDTSRIYYTGQSMGGIAGFVINENHPNFFAATYYVACQNDDADDFDEWPTGIENMKVIYTASMGDEQAYPGQQALQSYLDSVDCSYASVEVNPKGGDAVETAVNEMFTSNPGLNHYFIQYTAGILATDASKEHMNTWEYAYGITAAKEWLFDQTLETAAVNDGRTYTGIDVELNNFVANELLVGQTLSATNNVNVNLKYGSSGSLMINGMGVDEDAQDSVAFVVNGETTDSYYVSSDEWSVTVRYTGSRYNTDGQTLEATLTGTAMYATSIEIIPGSRSYTTGDDDEKTYTNTSVEVGSSVDDVTVYTHFSKSGTDTTTTSIDYTIALVDDSGNVLDSQNFVEGKNIIQVTSAALTSSGTNMVETLTIYIVTTEATDDAESTTTIYTDESNTTEFGWDNATAESADEGESGS